jgi:hypothetical protein
LAEAIDQAQRLAWALGIAEGDDPDAKDLYARLESARVEVESLRHAGWAGRSSDLGPNWMKFLSDNSPLFGAAD